jgi:hypothetical protein
MIVNKSFKLITIIEIVYIIYMFIFFKTHYSFNHPIEFIIESKLPQFFKHSIYKNYYSNKICLFGKYAIVLLSFYLLIRYLMFDHYKNYFKKSTCIVLLITFILSWLNMNAVVYLIPFFIVEFYLFINLYNNNKNVEIIKNIN